MIKFTEHQEQILKKNFDKHGEAFMRDKLVEELSELLCELCKHKTKGNRITQISEEFADVCVVFKQFDVDLVMGKYDTDVCIHFLTKAVKYFNQGYGINGMSEYYFIFNKLDFSIVQSTIDAKIRKMEGKSNQSEHYELYH